MALAGPALAQDADGDEVTTIDAVVVTASGFEQAIEEAPASISVITRDMLEKNFYTNVYDAMQAVPGVILTGGSDKQDISMRGMGSQYTLLLVDGKRQASAEMRTNSDGPGVEGGWTPPLGAIERIEVVRGPMSTLYGSDAIGGVINIITKKVPEDWSGQLRVDTTQQEDSRSGNEYQGGVYLAGPLKADLLGLQVHGQYSQRDEDNIVNGYRERKSDSVNARLSLTPSRDHDIVLEAGVSNQKYGQKVGKTIEDTPPPCGRFGCPVDTQTDYRNVRYGLSHTGRFDFGTLDTWVKRDAYENKSRRMDIENIDFQSSLVTSIGDKLALTTGVAYKREDLTDLEGNQLDTGITGTDRYQYSAFAESEWRLAEAFSLTTGLRMDHDQKYGKQYSPRVYGVWNPSEAWTFKGGVATGFRAPSLRQTVPGWGQVSRGGNMYGNPDLAAETSTNYELATVRRFKGGASVNFGVFYNQFKDKIERVGCPITQCTDGPNQYGSDPTTYINVNEAVTRGLEASVRIPLSEALSFSGSYTRMDSEQKSGPHAGRPLNQLPEHMLNVSLDYTPMAALSTWARINFRGKESQPSTDDSYGGGEPSPSYTVVDVGGAYRFNDQLALSLGIYNLLDEDITYDVYKFVEDGRRYWIGLTFDF